MQLPIPHAMLNLEEFWNMKGERSGAGSLLAFLSTPV